MVHRVVVDVVPDLEHRLGERGGFRPAEAHALVAGHVHDQAAGPEGVQVLGAQVRQRRVRVLQGAVDDDVALGEERRERHAAALGDDLAEERRLVVVVELRDPHRMDGGAHRGNPAVGQHLDIVDAVGVEGRDRAAGRGAEADDDGAQAAAVVTGGTGQGQGVQHRAVAGQFVVLVEHVQAEAAVAGPVVHRLERDQGELLVDRQLGDGPVLDAVRPAPEDLAVAAVRRGPRAAAWAGGRRRPRPAAARAGRCGPRAVPGGRPRRRNARRSPLPGSAAAGVPGRCGPGGGGGSGGAARQASACWQGLRG